MRTSGVLVGCVAALVGLSGCGGSVSGDARPESADSALDAVVGVWQGTYVCRQGETELQLTISEPNGGVSPAEFTFRTPAPSSVDGRFSMTAQFDQGVLVLAAGAWIEQPSGYITVDLRADTELTESTMAGHVLGDGCTTFAVSLGDVLA